MLQQYFISLKALAQLMVDIITGNTLALQNVPNNLCYRFKSWLTFLNQIPILQNKLTQYTQKFAQKIKTLTNIYKKRKRFRFDLWTE